MRGSCKYSVPNGDYSEEYSAGRLSSSLHPFKHLTKKKCVIDNSNTPVKFLPVCRSDQQTEEELFDEVDEISDYGFASSTNLPLETGMHVTRDLEQR